MPGPMEDSLGLGKNYRYTTHHCSIISIICLFNPFPSLYTKILLLEANLSFSFLLLLLNSATSPSHPNTWGSQLDSFHIYCRKWGVGRERYTTPGPWVRRNGVVTSLLSRLCFLQVHEIAQEVNQISSSLLDQGCQLLLCLFKVSPG